MKAKAEELHPGSWDMVRECVGRAICFDANLLAQDDPGEIWKPIKDPFSDIGDDALELDHFAVLAEISTALVPAIGRGKGTVGSEDFEREES